MELRFPSGIQQIITDYAEDEIRELFICACWHDTFGSLQPLQLLLNLRLNLKTMQSSTRYDILHCAISANREFVVHLLIDAGMPMEDVRRNENSVLHRLAILGRPSMIKILIKAGLTLEDLRSRANHAIWIAAYRGHTEVVKLLLESGLMPEEIYGESSLNRACEKGYESMVKLLLEIRPSMPYLDDIMLLLMGISGIIIINKNDIVWRHSHKSIMLMLLRTCLAIEDAQRNESGMISNSSLDGYNAVLRMFLGLGSILKCIRTGPAMQWRGEYNCDAEVQRFLELGAALENTRLGDDAIIQWAQRYEYTTTDIDQLSGKTIPESIVVLFNQGVYTPHRVNRRSALIARSNSRRDTITV